MSKSLWGAIEVRFRDCAEEATDDPYAVTEAALSHKVRNKMERAYRRSDLFDRRRTMMADWADFMQVD